MNTETYTESSPSLRAFLAQNQNRFAPVIRTPGKYIALDLSFRNTALQSLGIVNTSALTRYIFGEIDTNSGTVGIGGYDEDRRWYQRSESFVDSGEARTVHIGIDLWCEPGTPVFAPYEGLVHSFQDNAAFGDYGPTIILEHKGPDAPFFTLYGHLSRESLYGLQVGMKFNTGDRIGWIGSPPTNGDWPPHLHFQIISDMLGMRGDFPGVASQSKREYFLNLCPDPALMLTMPR